MNYPIIKGLALDSAGTDGATTEVSQVVTLEGNNAVQIQILLYVLTATTLNVQLQSSNDLANWTNEASVQTIGGIGRTLLTADTAVAASYVRATFSMEGSGKAIFNADLNVSPL
jgi:hypothetical protein